MDVDERIKAMVTERDAAIVSLDEAAIRAYCAKYKIAADADPLVFWAGIHKARAGLATMPAEAREQSAAWLVEHGFRVPRAA